MRASAGLAEEGNSERANKGAVSQRVFDPLVAATITLLSFATMIRCASPELLFQGPMAIYLAKPGAELIPRGAASLEFRLRFFDAIAGSIAVALVYWLLRRVFKTSVPAALAASALLLFSVIRLEETNIIGPHHLTLLCTISLAALGYGWRNTPHRMAAVALGSIMGFGAVFFPSDCGG